MAALERMRFSTRHRIEGAYSGRHLSRHQGGAGEFADYREYVEGEDLRRLDWKVLARTGRAYTRLYEDETNLTSLLTNPGRKVNPRAVRQRVSTDRRARSWNMRSTCPRL